MKQFSKKDLITLVESCWEIANTANMRGVPPGTVISADAEGNVVNICQIRLSTYLKLLESLVPKMVYNEAVTRMVEERQEWQGKKEDEEDENGREKDDER